MAEYQDNYEIVREDWKKKAITWNYEERYRALGLPGYSEHGKLPVIYYGRKYEIDGKPEASRMQRIGTGS